MFLMIVAIKDACTCFAFLLFLALPILFTVGVCGRSRVRILNLNQILVPGVFLIRVPEYLILQVLSLLSFLMVYFCHLGFYLFIERPIGLTFLLDTGGAQ